MRAWPAQIAADPTQAIEVKTEAEKSDIGDSKASEGNGGEGGKM